MGGAASSSGSSWVMSFALAAGQADGKRDAADVRTAYNDVVAAHADLSPLCDRVCFGVPEALSPDDRAAIENYARGISIDLVVGQT